MINNDIVISKLEYEVSIFSFTSNRHFAFSLQWEEKERAVEQNPSQKV